MFAKAQGLNNCIQRDFCPKYFLLVFIRWFKVQEKANRELEVASGRINVAEPQSRAD